MSVREYIGARYVPLFMGDWSSSNAYEPLSVVMYQGNSYVSRQAVPKNIDITNEQYWILAAEYNAQIEQYRQEVATFDSRIDALEEITYPLSISNGGTGAATAANARTNLNAASLAANTYTDTQKIKSSNINRDGELPSSTATGKRFTFTDADDESLMGMYPQISAVGTVMAQVTAYNEDSEGNQLTNTLSVGIRKNGDRVYSLSDPEAFRTAIGALGEQNYKKKCILIGDSYLRTTSVQTGWGDKFIAYTGFEEILRYKSGGAGWVNPGTNDTETGLNFVQMLEKAKNNLTTTQRSQIEFIIVQGGINDIIRNINTSSITSAISTFVANARSYFPNAKVVISMALCSKQWMMSDAAVYIDNWLRIWLTQGAIYGCHSNLWFVGRTETWGREDDLHPNDDGYAYLARKMASLANGATYDPPYWYWNATAIKNMIEAQIPSFSDWGSVNTDSSNIVFDDFMAHVSLRIDITDATAIPSGLNAFILPFKAQRPNSIISHAFGILGNQWVIRPSSAGTGSARDVYAHLTPDFRDNGTALAYTNSTHVYYGFDVLL
ncbi:MAG: hypothetical protein IKE94_01165 [Aeriscardovia sp.]|nr:hypothetical protein [Aeriscardovia sp.]